MQTKTYFAWMNKNTKELVEFNNKKLYSSKRMAFKSFRKYIGKESICESIQDNYYLVTTKNNNIINVTDINPRDISDCINCPWGLMKLDRDNWYECDTCGNKEFHN